jgi:threonine/homoserine/homoserine lactone efflux protein
LRKLDLAAARDLQGLRHFRPLNSPLGNTTGGTMFSSNFVLYIGACLLVIIAPGPGMLYVISQGLSSGRRVGVLAALGTSCGIALHIAAAALGVTAILHISEVGFQILKWLGVSYLLYLAWEVLVRRQVFNAEAVVATDSSRIFWKGALINALNPKVALFFLAFLPQFVAPRLIPIPVQMVFLGTIFLLLTVIVFTIYGLMSGLIRTYVIRHPRVRRMLETLTGSLFLYLGFRLAMASRE